MKPQVLGTVAWSWLDQCPFGTVGDRLWVRETWQFCDYDGPGGEPKTDVVYRADGETDDKRKGWIPSIHMERWASRITLEITSVRVERLQEISEADATSEGMHKFSSLELWGHDPKGTRGPMLGGTAVEAFALLWQSINGDGSWAANPWVWVVEFKRVEQEKVIA